VLGLLLERIVEIRTGDPWRNVLDKLQTIKVVEYERDGVVVRQTTELRPRCATSVSAPERCSPTRFE